MSYDCGHKSCDSHVCLTERLAQAERERDAAKAEEGTWRKRWVEDVAEMQRQRDAALAKAEAADELALKCDGLQVSLNLLRARIEALADKWQATGHRGSEIALRTLLQPPKDETALDVLSRAEKAYDCDGYTLTATDMAKLRKLLEGAQ